MAPAAPPGKPRCCLRARGCIRRHSCPQECISVAGSTKMYSCRKAFLSTGVALEAFNTEAFVTTHLKGVLLDRPHVVELVLRHLRYNCSEPFALHRICQHHAGDVAASEPAHYKGGECRHPYAAGCACGKGRIAAGRGARRHVPENGMLALGPRGSGARVWAIGSLGVLGWRGEPRTRG